MMEEVKEGILAPLGLTRNNFTVTDGQSSDLLSVPSTSGYPFSLFSLANWQIQQFALEHTVRESFLPRSARFFAQSANVVQLPAPHAIH